MVKVKLMEDNPIVLNGDITGRMYIFRNIYDAVWMDRRDVTGMKQINGLQVIHS